MRYLSAVILALVLSCGFSAFAEDELVMSSTSTLKSEVPQTDSSLVPQPFTQEDKPVRAKYSPWGTAYFNWATQNMRDTRNGVGRLSSYNFVSLDYRLGNGRKLSIRPTFFLNGAGNDFMGRPQESDFGVGDIYLQYFHYNLALLPGNIGMSGAFRAYVPISENSRDQTLITRFQARMFFTKPLGYGAQVTYVVEPRYFVYRDRAFLFRDGTFEQARGNRWGALWHYMEFAERIGDSWGLSQTLGFMHQWNYEVPASGIANRITDRFETNVGAFFDLGTVMFRLSLLNSIDIRRPRQGFQLYREDETEYSLMTYVRF